MDRHTERRLKGSVVRVQGEDDRPIRVKLPPAPKGMELEIWPSDGRGDPSRGVVIPLGDGRSIRLEVYELL
jgi:hypothetical protein